MERVYLQYGARDRFNLCDTQVVAPNEPHDSDRLSFRINPAQRGVERSSLP
jgi:hypothetical protein